MIRGIQDGVRDLGFVRAAMLTRSGFALGWLSEDEDRTLSRSSTTRCRCTIPRGTRPGRPPTSLGPARWLWAAEGPEEERRPTTCISRPGRVPAGQARGLWRSLRGMPRSLSPLLLRRGRRRRSPAGALRQQLASAWEREAGRAGALAHSPGDGQKTPSSTDAPRARQPGLTQPRPRPTMKPTDSRKALSTDVHTRTPTVRHHRRQNGQGPHVTRPRPATLAHLTFVGSLHQAQS